VQQLETSDQKTTSGVLLSVNSILKRFRYAYKSDALYSEIKYVLNIIAAPLTTLLMRLSQELDSAGNDVIRSGGVLESIRLICRIFYSLNWQDLPEFFEDHMAEWMHEFEKYLRYDNNNVDEGECAVEHMQAAVVENASLYAHKYEEEFAPFLPRFVSAIWQRVVSLTLLPKHDRLAAASIRFIAEVVSKQMHASLFSDEATIRQIIDSIVIPNMFLRHVDVELFEDSPLEYISRDLENADSETRRRGACDLINALCKHHNLITTHICAGHISTMFQQYAASPGENWRAKDAALHLVIALTGRAETQLCPSKASNQLNVLEIYSTHIMGELASDPVSQPVILADAIQFICIFRDQIASDELLRVLPLLGHHLLNSKVVVQSYAAACLDRILAIPRKLSRHELQPIVNPLFEALFSALDTAHADHDERTDAIWENEYIMKVIMRLLVVSQDIVFPIAQVIAGKLCSSLRRVCTNPRNPKFNHYLFESLAVLVRVTCELDGNHASTNHFERILFPPFQSILQMDVAEFAPYVFQILALLLGYQDSLSDAYVSLLPPLLHPMLWERRANVPALTSLLQSYLIAGIDHIVQQSQLEPFLGVFQKLLASKQSETYAFDLLKSIIVCVDSTMLDIYISTILQLLMTRLQQHRERFDFCNMFFAFITVIAAKHGGASIASSLENKQAGLLSNLILHVFSPHVGRSKFVASLDVKCAIIGVTRILCEVPDFLTERGDTVPWNTLLAILNELLCQYNGTAFVVHERELNANNESVDIGGYDATFSRLHFGLKREDDMFPEIQDAQQFALSHLQELSTRCPHFEPLIAALRQSR